MRIMATVVKEGRLVGRSQECQIAGRSGNGRAGSLSFHRGRALSVGVSCKKGCPVRSCRKNNTLLNVSMSPMLLSLAEHSVLGEVFWFF